MQQIKSGLESKKIVERYHDWLISTENSIHQVIDENGNFEWDRPCTNDHQCTKSFSKMNQKQRETDYTNLINSVERHTYCKPGYCLRRRTVKDKNNPEGKIEEYCRFNFPFEKCEKTELIFEETELRDKQIKYIPKIVSKRNDPLVNRHDQWILQCWRANKDRQLLLDAHSTISYTTKYATKAEKSSLQLLRALEKMIKYTEDHDLTAKVVNKIMNKIIGNRDYSKNEVCYFAVGQ